MPFVLTFVFEGLFKEMEGGWWGCTSLGWLLQGSPVLSPSREFKGNAVLPHAGMAQTWVFGSEGASIHLNKCFSVDSKFALLLVWE